MNNDDNENLSNIFNISNNRLNSQSNFDDFMINQLTNILTNRINSNSNNFLVYLLFQIELIVIIVLFLYNQTLMYQISYKIHYIKAIHTKSNIR